MRQEEHSGQEQAKVTNITRRTLAIFISAGLNHALRVCEIADSLRGDYHAVYSAIRRYSKYGFIKKVNKGFRRVFYVLVDKEAALDYLDSNIAVLGGVPRSGLGSFFGDWLDLGGAVLEYVGPVGFVVDGYVASKIRGFLEGLGCRVRRGDRAKQLSYACNSFSLRISVHGRVGLWIKSVDWVSDFNDFLVGCGLDDANRAFVFRKVAERVQGSRTSVEVPVLSDDVPKGVTIKTKVGDVSLVSRISGSHFPKELEVQGTFGAVQNFLTALAGSQHFSMLEWLQADRLDKIRQALDILGTSYDRTARILESLANESITNKIQAQQEKPEGRGKGDLYIA